MTDGSNNQFTISGGNFHGEYPAKACDYLAIAVHEIANISERRLVKKERKLKYVYNSSYKKASDSTGYKDSYVIVNGKRIENVEEAINVTKYSFQIFANNVSEKLVQPKVVEDDY